VHRVCLPIDDGSVAFLCHHHSTIWTCHIDQTSVNSIPLTIGCRHGKLRQTRATPFYSVYTHTTCRTRIRRPRILRTLYRYCVWSLHVAMTGFKVYSGQRRQRIDNLSDAFISTLLVYFPFASFFSNHDFQVHVHALWLQRLPSDGRYHRPSQRRTLNHCTDRCALRLFGPWLWLFWSWFAIAYYVYHYHSVSASPTVSTLNKGRPLPTIPTVIQKVP